MPKLGFIGLGKMGGAMIEGIIKKEIAAPDEIGVYDIARAQADCYAAKGCIAYADAGALVGESETLVLAVKPQSFASVAPKLGRSLRHDTVVVSVMAGISAEAIKKAAGFDCKVVLVMPNTPLLIGEGATALARVEPTTKEEFSRVKEIFSAAGVAEEISPNHMREVIPVNGSSPAFVYLFAKTLTDCAVKAGIGEAEAKSLVIQTLIGSARTMRDSGRTVDELIEMVCSPGGTTIASMEALEQYGFSAALEQAVDACVRRAGELADISG